MLNNVESLTLTKYPIIENKNAGTDDKSVINKEKENFLLDFKNELHIVYPMKKLWINKAMEKVIPT